MNLLTTQTFESTAIAAERGPTTGLGRINRASGGSHADTLEHNVNSRKFHRWRAAKVGPAASNVAIHQLNLNENDE